MSTHRNEVHDQSLNKSMTVNYEVAAAMPLSLCLFNSVASAAHLTAGEVW